MSTDSSDSLGAPIYREAILQQYDRLVEQLIREGKIVEPHWWAYPPARLMLFFVYILACMLAAGAYQWWLFEQPTTISDRLPNGAQLATVFITSAAAILAYYQWIEARREASLEKFYDRLKLVNERYYEWPAARKLVGHFWRNSDDDDEFQRRMYVFLELDNLEYMIIRYKLGYVRKNLLRRAIRTFSSRCYSDKFCLLATQLVGGSGYEPRTGQVTRLLIEHARCENLPPIA